MPSSQRAKALPLEFAGVHSMDEEEIDAATRALRALREPSPIRCRGLNLRNEVDEF